MKVIVFLLFLLLLTENSFAQQGNHFTKFETVTIGSQVWMKRNLDVDHYGNRDPIKQGTGMVDWAEQEKSSGEYLLSLN
jgi:hypothetical protein